MADLYTADESQAWFGWIASGGSIGSLAGSGVALLCARWFDIHAMLLICAVLLELGLGLAYWLHRERSYPKPTQTQPSNTLTIDTNRPRAIPKTMGRGALIYAGHVLVLKSRYLLSLCLFVIWWGNLRAPSSTTICRTQAARSPRGCQAGRSLCLHAVLQSTRKPLVTRGCGRVDDDVSRVRASSFFSTDSGHGLLWVVVLCQDLTSLMTGHSSPTMHWLWLAGTCKNALFSVVTREEKYKSKAFTDTVVFRGSDVLASQACKQMDLLGVAFAFLCGAMIPISGLWCLSAFLLGTMYQRRFDIARPDRLLAVGRKPSGLATPNGLRRERVSPSFGLLLLVLSYDLDLGQPRGRHTSFDSLLCVGLRSLSPRYAKSAAHMTHAH